MGSQAKVAKAEAPEFKIGSIPSRMSDAESKWMEAVEKLQTRQSPIDIKQSSAKYQDYRPFSLIGHENLSISSGTLTATNTGTAAKLLASPDTAWLEGGPLNVRYEFVEMHFHWGDRDNKAAMVGSEHTLDSVAFPLELHMVHKNSHDPSVGDALNHENGICVLGFLFTLVKDDADISTVGMDALTKIVEEHLQSPNAKFGQEALNNFNVVDVNVANFLPLHLNEYFHYRGSLTTGGCEEAVNWVVFRTPVAIKERHLRALHSIKNAEGGKICNNYRPTMPVYKRPIYYKGSKLMDQNIISRGKDIGLRSKRHAEVVDEEDLKKLSI